MSPSLTTFLFEAANFLVLAGVLGWLFFAPVRKALADRHARYENDLEQAAQKLAGAKAAQDDIDAQLAGFQQDLNEVRTRELEAARHQAEQLLDDARKTIEQEREQNQRQAARMSETQQDRLAEVAAIAAAETVGRLLEQMGGPELQSVLMDAACQQLKSMPQESLAPVKVESAETLSAEQRERLIDILGTAASSTDFRTTKDLGTGVRIATRQGLIDATVGGLRQFARQALIAEMNRPSNNHNPLQNSHDD